MCKLSSAMLPFSGLEHSTSMLGDIVLFTYDELIIVITLMSEEYNNNTQLLRSIQVQPPLPTALRPIGTPCSQHVYTLVRNKYMHVAKHVHGLILQLARGKQSIDLLVVVTI